MPLEVTPMFLRPSLIVGATLCPLVVCATAFASKGKHKSHGAHEHGNAKLNLVVEGNKLTAQLEVPSESIYGFEYEPKSEKDKKQREAGGEKLKSSFEKMLVIDKSLGCAFQNTKLDLHASDGGKGHDDHKSGKKGEHSETRAEFVATCQKPLAGTKVSFAFGKVFPRIKEIKVQVISDSKQSGADIDNDKGDVTL
ncbi:MAG: DUF2796 domain-containing protein [Rhodocyclaceae bacterium]|nr:DUF2796 domain-containing protein [Rhodocyclaceae bacterium]